ncbi:hypothetical protein [Acinetobacter rathckeae]|uniref:hypothetical protein n=1 Tax=Acinetobacter rathckeae TaxID=2605272 RepID=UPI0018A2E00C|nr:hypothetical protein [Acinetobacter rathckeae]MBF7687059.1 hypothetical protein [Acinetobacter rathckeae]
MSEFKVGDYLVFNDINKHRGVIVKLEDIQLKKVFVPSIRVHGYLLDLSDVRHATPEEIKAGRRLP